MREISVSADISLLYPHEDKAATGTVTSRKINTMEENTMDNNILSAFKTSVQAHAEEIRTAQKAYITAKAAEEAIKEISEDIQRKILAENIYTVSPEFKNRRGIGERITEPKHTYLMDEEIFLNDFLDKCYAEYHKAGIADSRGKEYIPEAVARDTRLDAEKALMQLAIDILPDIPEKETLRKATTHWKYREQILELILRLDA